MVARKKEDNQEDYSLEDMLNEVDLEAVAHEISDELTELEQSQSQTAAAQLEQSQAEATELRDRFQRLQAEWDNFRKRTATEREQERRRATERLMESLLPVVDDLERAIEHSETSNETALREGIAAVFAKLSEVLAKEGLQVIDPVDEAFDAHLHQAVGKTEDAHLPDETVTQVYQKGYQMADRVLRPAMVVVSTGGKPREEK
ncbi:MAG: nucleotide exchange factor GrpE [Coriobacteriales bacterium]|jgi:molecular chaperone GrpE|nr:nucleotide exchange factor GrpE [Coriobacteriales bacterium]